jgi:hypothetical protein
MFRGAFGSVPMGKTTCLIPQSDFDSQAQCGATKAGGIQFTPGANSGQRVFKW